LSRIGSFVAAVELPGRGLIGYDRRFDFNLMSSAAYKSVARS